MNVYTIHCIVYTVHCQPYQIEIWMYSFEFCLTLWKFHGNTLMAFPSFWWIPMKWATSEVWRHGNRCGDAGWSSWKKIVEIFLKHEQIHSWNIIEKNTFLLRPKNKALSVLTSKCYFFSSDRSSPPCLSAQDNKGLLVTDSSSTQLMHPHNSFYSEIFEWVDFASFIEAHPLF